MNSKIEKAKNIRSAIKEGSLEFFNELISFDESLLTMMTPFGTWLHVAASFGELEIVKRLLELGADIDARGGTYGGGALNTAASEGNLEVVNYFLSYGAELDVSDPTRNPLFGAIYCGNMDIVNTLIAAGIDVEIKYTGDSMTNMGAVEFALERGETEIAARLSEEY